MIKQIINKKNVQPTSSIARVKSVEEYPPEYIQRLRSQGIMPKTESTQEKGLIKTLIPKSNS